MVDRPHLPGSQIGRKHGIWLGQGKTHHRPVKRPIPAFLPRERSRQVSRILALPDITLYNVGLFLLVRREHFEQKATLRSLIAERLEEPQLQSVMVRIVMLLANQYVRRHSEARDQLLRSQGLPTAKFPNHAQIHMFVPLRALPGR